MSIIRPVVDFVIRPVVDFVFSVSFPVVGYVLGIFFIFGENGIPREKKTEFFCAALFFLRLYCGKIKSKVKSLKQKCFTQGIMLSESEDGAHGD